MNGGMRLGLVTVTDLYRHLPKRSLAAKTLRLVHLRDHLMRKAKKRMTRRLLLQLLRSARPKLRPRLPLRRPRPSPWVTKPLRETSSLVVFLTISTKNGSLANSRALGNCLAFGLLLIVILAAPKGNPTAAIGLNQG